MSRRDGCEGKKRHHNLSGAMIHMKKLKEPGMNAYPCSYCGGWHIGHRDRETGIQRRLDRLLGPDPRTLKHP
jgi:hypothetical protein